MHQPNLNFSSARKEPVHFWLASVSSPIRLTGWHSSSPQVPFHCCQMNHSWPTKGRQLFSLRPHSEEKQRPNKSVLNSGPAICGPRELNDTANDRQERTGATWDHQWLWMLGPTKDHQRTCGRPHNESVSCTEDHCVGTMDVPMPGHPSSCSRSSPNTPQARRGCERPRSPQNHEQEQEIED